MAAFYIMLVCLSIRLYLTNVKTAEPIRPKFCVGPYMTPVKVFGTSKLEEKKSRKILGFILNAPIRKGKFAKI